VLPSAGVRRGEIVRVRLDPVEGAEQAGERPALVISPDLVNQHSPVILVAAISSRKTERVYPFEALLVPPEGGLTSRSKVLLMQLRSIARRRIIGSYGVISALAMGRVEAALRVAVGLVKL
jgi:mRNA interferase MazF